MKKIGIITYYYNSRNYGGLLQSYALEHYLIDLGYDAKQICVSYIKRDKSIQKKRLKSIFEEEGFINLVIRIFKNIIKRINNIFNRTLGKIFNADSHINSREESVKHFRDDLILHTDDIYDQSTINNCKEFDVYICGSDQVWRGINRYDDLNPAYWLTFVESNKSKISYAASISLPNIPRGAELKVKKALLDFDAISVREKSDKEILQKILDRSVDWVVDPTMLLSKKEWNKLCVYNKYKEQNYIFAYFLGGNTGIRKWVMKFAKKNDLQVITIPYLLDTFRISDVRFGDIRLSSVSPQLWLTLIKDAKYVFTDSFHGTVFSLLFHKQFFTFCRDSNKSKSSGNSRIYSLFSMQYI